MTAASTSPIGHLALSEAQWQSWVIELATRTGWWSYHTHDSRRSNPGWPDLTLIRDTEIVYVELKKYNGKVSDAQAHVMVLLENAGQEVHVWRPQDRPDVIARLSRRKKAA